MKKTINGLYAVTSDLADTTQLLSLVKSAIAGGASIVQYRNKLASADLRRTQAQALLDLCQQSRVPLIINDHVDLCAELGADGVHLGAEDGAIAAARQTLGPARIIGASCYNRLELAEAAREQSADYVAFGSCFGSRTKPAAVQAPLTLFAEAKRITGLPTVAIGGITADNAPVAIAAGADAIAVIDGLWSAGNIQQRACAFSNLFNTPTP